MAEMLKTIAALMMASALASCLHSEPTLDASNPTVYQTSLARMKDALAPAGRKALDEAVISIVMNVSGELDYDVDEDNLFEQLFAEALPRVFNTAMAANPNRAAELVVNSAGNLIHGKTADEIIRLAKEKQLERLAAQSPSWMSRWPFYRSRLRTPKGRVRNWNARFPA